MKLTKEEKSWILYDVANSAFVLLLSTTIPIYFSSLVTRAGKTPAEATGIFALATSIAVLAVALLAPILGAIADFKGMKKKLFFTSLMVVSHWSSQSHGRPLFSSSSWPASAIPCAMSSMTPCSPMSPMTINSISSPAWAMPLATLALPFLLSLVL